MTRFMLSTVVASAALLVAGCRDDTTAIERSLEGSPGRLSQHESPKTEPGTDEDRLQGQWEVVFERADGRIITQSTGDRFIFDGSSLEVIHRVGEADVPDMSFKLDSTKMPKHFDLLFADGNRLPGIFEFNRDKLVLCMGGLPPHRPTEFKSKKGDNRSMAILERASP